jgi:hypothetical protein
MSLAILPAGIFINFCHGPAAFFNTANAAREFLSFVFWDNIVRTISSTASVRLNGLGRP